MRDKPPDLCAWSLDGKAYGVLLGQLGKGHSAGVFRLRRSVSGSVSLSERVVAPISQGVGSDAQFSGHAFKRASATKE